MTDTSPRLETLLHRLSECPPEFYADEANCVALACDYLRDFNLDADLSALRDKLHELSHQQTRLINVLIWLVSDDWFRSRPELERKLEKLLAHPRIVKLGSLLQANNLVQDPDRREELVRLAIDILGMRPAGESDAQATDRLNTLDTHERQRVLRATLAAEKRAREVREAMAKAKAMESASRYGE